jgi:peptide/nickel transport system permease protein
VLCTVFGIAAGVVSAANQYGLADKAITFVVLLGISIPPSFLGMMMILIFAVNLRWFPVSGMWPIYGDRDIWVLLDHLAMPATALPSWPRASSRGSRARPCWRCCGRTSSAPRGPRACHERRVIWGHALRAAMVSIIPVLGIQAGFVLSGAVYIEIVFQWPGVGRMLVDAILKRDILLVQGGVVFVAACYVMFNIVVDVAQSLLDPRIKT